MRSISDPFLRQQFEEYFRLSVPVNWVIWWSDANEFHPDDARPLRAVLFDPATDALHDLTEPDIRDRVYEVVVTHSPRLFDIACKYAEEFWQRVRDEQAQGI